MERHGSPRSGRWQRQSSGYDAFVPTPLPPDPPLHFDLPLVGLLTDAATALGALDGSTTTLPNPDLFVAMYVRREAVLSSQIEGTRSTLDDLLAFEVDPGSSRITADVEEVVNYVQAMNHGLERLDKLPLSLRLIRELHGILLQGTRGQDKSPGEFRTTQNWIGRRGTQGLVEADFVPPPPQLLMDCLGPLELFLHDPAPMHPLIACALAHVQFETIHPFLDGNGRLGRLLITFQLVHAGVMRQPLLYLSLYIKQRRPEYYRALTAVRTDGDWEGWLRFFLQGVLETSIEARRSAEAIVDLREGLREELDREPVGSRGTAFLDLLFAQPLLNVAAVRDRLGVTSVTAGRLVDAFVARGWLREVTGQRRNRLFRFDDYLASFQEVEEGDHMRTHTAPTAPALTQVIDLGGEGDVSGPGKPSTERSQGSDR